MAHQLIIWMVDDGKKLHEDFGVQPQGLLDLGRLAHVLDTEYWPKDSRRTFEKPISLQHLVARVSLLTAFVAAR